MMMIVLATHFKLNLALSCVLQKKVCVVCSLNGEGFVIVAILNMQISKDRQTKVQKKLFICLIL